MALLVPMRSRTRNSSGFTLIEILITLAISSALIGVTVAGYGDFASRQAVDSATRVLYSGLRLAQSKATSGEKPASCSGSFDGYRFRFLSSGGNITSFEMRPICSGTELTGTTTALPTNVTYTLSGTTPSFFTFKPLGLGTDVSPASPATITVSRSVAGATRSFVVTVTSSGEIK